MTWIDWATLTCVVYAALLSTMVAIRQQLRIRGDRELRVLECLYHDSGVTHVSRVVEADLAAPTAECKIQAGDPVYWDGRLPGCVTKTPSGNNQAGHRLDAAVFGVALSDSQPVDPSRRVE